MSLKYLGLDIEIVINKILYLQYIYLTYLLSK